MHVIMKCVYHMRIEKECKNPIICHNTLSVDSQKQNFG